MTNHIEGRSRRIPFVHEYRVERNFRGKKSNKNKTTVYGNKETTQVFKNT